jgi:hypothetical protein
MNKQIELLCKKLESHSVSLVYTPCNRNVTNPDVHCVWRPWQIIAWYIDDSRKFFRHCKTAQKAIDSAINEMKTNHRIHSDRQSRRPEKTQRHKIRSYL